MAGFIFRVNDVVVRATPFEHGGEKGVLSAMVEWMAWHEDREICDLIDLPTPFAALHAGDEVTIEIVDGDVAAFAPETDHTFGIRPREHERDLLRLDVSVNGKHLHAIESARSVTAEVCWIVPTAEMLARNVTPRLGVTTATGPDDIRGWHLEPGMTVTIRLR